MMRWPLLLFTVWLTPLLAHRETIELSNSWSFIRQDMGPTATPDAHWSAVSIPHTWNVPDGQNGKAADPRLPDGYYRGAGWYYRELPVPVDLGERRAILRFEGVTTVSDVYVNDRHVGQHRGGYTAFAFDVTPFLRKGETNVLRVRADNSRFPDVAPLNGDFTFFGGIYRPVSLILVEPVHVTLLDHGSRGIYVAQKQVTKAKAEIEVRVKVINRLASDEAIEVETVIVDREGRTVAEAKRTAVLRPGEMDTVTVPLTVAAPRRWHGQRDPYLYEAKATLRRAGRVADEVAAPLGLRTVAIDEARGFLLNGEPYPVYGVNRHQDWIDRGTALLPSDHEHDLRMIVEMGGTAIRLGHYPQSEAVHRLADELGLLLWEEIPNIERVPSLPEFAPVMRQQLVEMVLQGYNHPSIVFWGLYNEAKATWLSPMGAPPEPLVRELRELTQELDPSRLIVGASWLRHRDPLHDETPYPAFNQYPGWKFDTPQDMGRWIKVISDNHGGRRIAISEYGAGASVYHQQETGMGTPVDTASPFHPEGWQAIVHEGNWADIKDNPRIWGSFVWIMFDFAADHRNEGDTPGRNDKGLVTYDRRIKKDAFFFYQANWTGKPMVHITGRRLERRRINPVEEVKVYSNGEDVELLVNGISRGRVRPDRIAVCRWRDVALQPGHNRIEAVARGRGYETRDACSWFLVE